MKNDDRKQKQEPKQIVTMKHLRLIQGGGNEEGGGDEKKEEYFFKQEERW